MSLMLEFLKINDIVDELEPIGSDHCDKDADQAIDGTKEITGGHKVWYSGRMKLFDKGDVKTTYAHCVARTDSGLIIDVNQPKGQRVFRSGADYWNNSLNSIEKLD